MVYSVIIDSLEAKVIPEFRTSSPEDEARNTLIVVIDVINKCEIVLRNPSSGQITAVYVDGGVLMLGSNSSIHSTKP